MPEVSLGSPETACLLSKHVTADFQLSSLEDRSLFAATQCSLIESGVEEIWEKTYFSHLQETTLCSNAQYPEEDHVVGMVVV